MEPIQAKLAAAGTGSLLTAITSKYKLFLCRSGLLSFSPAPASYLYLVTFARIAADSDPIRRRQDKVADATPEGEVPSTVRTSPTKCLLSAK